MVEALVNVEHLTRRFTVGDGWLAPRLALTAVDAISFEIGRGDILGLVGESGSGKSTLGKMLVGLHRPSSGSAFYDGIDITSHDLQYRDRLNREIQMVFQDPYSSLNPRKRIEQILGEPLSVRMGLKGDRCEARIGELLDVVNLDRSVMRRFPHQLSGGQRQRVGIARALSLEPQLLVLDEPIASLDVSVQAQIINLLSDLKARLSLTMLFIAHDLNIVRHISSHVAVMYLGKLVEIGTRAQVFERPAHPYTRALMSAAPIPDRHRERSRQRIVLTGEMPSPIHPPKACPFHTRCPIARAVCGEVTPELVVQNNRQRAACHFPFELTDQMANSHAND